ncbi:hypothetical protein SAMN03159463_05336 [Mesorhizobium sp. NFR06]|nr:hypothetical protein SAMN03159463_05336 [Mesorhizobium sp. NFR06]
MGPGKLGFVFGRLTFLKDGIKLGCHTDKGSGRRFRQFFEQGLRSVGRLVLSKHRSGVSYFRVGSIPARLMGRELGFGVRANNCVDGVDAQ